MSTKNKKEWQAANTKNTLNLAKWTGAWVITMAAAAFGPKFFWDHNAWLTGTALAFNFLVGLGMIGANIRYLKGLDEMQQKIFLNASALSLGVALVAGLSYEMLSTTKLVSIEPDISHLVFLISVVFMTSLIVGQRRYQ